jgi:DNA-binding transcriptional regulator YdaS (Cro superfamily)
MNEKTAIQRAVDIAGGQTALARLCGVTPQAVQKWESQGYVPHRRVPQVVRAIDFKMSYHEFDSYLWPIDYRPPCPSANTANTQSTT